MVLLEITSLYSSGPNKGSHFTKSYRSYMIWPLSPQTSMSSPHLYASHTGLLLTSHTPQTYTCLRAFALAVPSVWCILPFR